MHIVIGIICVAAGAAIGFGFMFWVAREMVRKVRAQEDAKHNALLQETANQAGEWIDIVNDILDAVQEGKLQNRSVNDQSKTIRNIIKKNRGADA